MNPVTARKPLIDPHVKADAGALVLAGLDHHRAGRLSEAEALYAQALRADPDNADALNLSGAVAFTTGRVEDAVRLIGKAVRLNPGHMDAYLNLAEAQEAAGRRSEAIGACQKALALAPDFAEGHSRLAWLRANSGEDAVALGHARVALALEPTLVEALCAQGLALKQLRRPAEADAAYRRALELAPDDLRALSGHGVLLGEMDLVEEPVALFRRAVELRPNDVALLHYLAHHLELAGDIAGALEVIDKALKLAPNAPELRFSRGRCLRDIGDFAGAEATFLDVLKAHPKFAPALHALGRLKRLPDDADHRKQLSRLIADTSLPPRHRVQAGFALGDLLDRAGEYDAAFGRFAEANAIYRKSRSAAGESYNRQEIRASGDLFESRLASEFARDTDLWSNPTDLPVFVVGMPRSGTTLVEQICASHSQVAGLGESTIIRRLAEVIAAHNVGREHVGDWDASFSRAAADKHAAELARQAGGARRAVDKTPFNVLRLGLVGGLFPNARVIWCRRDPRDVVVSNHTMYFGTGNAFSTDLSDCAYATRHTDRIGAIWRDQGKLPVLEVVYEDLVADLDTHVRRIIDFLGLDWEPACLNFHQTERHVDTPSSWQVRQPIYSNSVGRWRRFEKHLGPMLETLAGND
jgi:tetratricopeptide (TPR) repeat protein